MASLLLKQQCPRPPRDEAQEGWQLCPLTPEGLRQSVGGDSGAGVRGGQTRPGAQTGEADLVWGQSQCPGGRGSLAEAPWRGS